MIDRMRDAARQRGTRERYRYEADRPQQRRNDEGERHGPVLVRGALARSEVRGLSDTSSALAFEGLASVTGQSYEMWDWYGPYAEVVDVGAFASTLSRDDLDVPLVLQHESMRRIARTVNASSTLELDEVTEGDVTGLHVLAPNLDRDDPDTSYIVGKLSSGLIDEMSFRFSITRGQWSPDWTEYHIQEVDIHRGDVAIVGYGANPATVGGLRSAGGRLASASLDDLRAELQRRGEVERVVGRPAALALIDLALAEDI
ncbi:MAG: hypothetical protein A2135_10090 [Actinobacteria bacterium RBG_16_67_15]|nr:MAG: hypothetical protein A2135_10090 [Actinobacteria bacterium RBG_16_67_15]